MGNLQELYSELIQIDTSRIGDDFRWIFEKGLEISLIDYEEEIEEMEEKLELARREFNDRKAQIHDDISQAQFKHWLNYNKHLKEDLDSLKKSVDEQFIQDEEDIDCPSSGEAMYNFLEMYIDRMPISHLAVAMDVLEQLHYKKEISWYYYVECGLAVSYRLTKAAPKGGWEEILEKLRAWKQAHHTKSATYDDNCFASMNLNIEDAIDFMSKVKDLANKSNCSVEEIYYQLMEEQQLEDNTPILERMDIPEDDCADFDYTDLCLAEPNNISL